LIFLETLGEFLNENGETIIDEEEYGLIAKLQELKGTYRTDYDQWKNLKSEITYCQNLVNQCQNRLLQGRKKLFLSKENFLFFII
jgi:kinesin family protein 6/9